MMQNEFNKLTFSKKQFEDALDTLQDVLEQPENVYIRDATIQRFEYTYEACWKFMKAIFAIKGLISRFPRDVFKESLQAEFIRDFVLWEDMMKDRNLTSHTYKERTAEQVYLAIRNEYYPAFRYFQEKITKVVEDTV